MFLVNEIGELIYEYGEKFKETSIEKTKVLEKFVLDRLKTIVDGNKNDEIIEYVKERYLKQIEKNLGLLFEKCDRDEKEFYSNYMKTVDLVFKTETENRMKVIYLENIIKKLENKKTEDISLLSIKKSDDESRENDLLPDDSVNDIFNKMVTDITKKCSLSNEQLDEFQKRLLSFKAIYEHHIKDGLNKYSEYNKNCVISGIITEMDNQKLREGKTRKQFLEEKKLAELAEKKSKELLDVIVRKNEAIALSRLGICSTNMVNLIFRLLPDEYKSQRQLLEIIIDTAINEKVGNIIREEGENITRILDNENKKIIKDEIYDEKRYGNSSEYKFDNKIIDKTYKGIIEEIRLAYDIDKNSIESKKLDFSVSVETNSTKKIFSSLINDITNENRENIARIKEDIEKIELENSVVDNDSIKIEKKGKK